MRHAVAPVGHASNFVEVLKAPRTGPIAADSIAESNILSRSLLEQAGSNKPRQSPHDMDFPQDLLQ